jgi:outer membrane cobalamin receptor
MLLDAQLLFSDLQAVTATANSTNLIDTLAARDIAAGEDLYVTCVVTTTTVSAGSTTLTITLETDDNSSFSSATTLYTTSAIPKATLVAGYRALAFKLPRYTERYLRLVYTVAVADFSAGKFLAGLTLTGTISDELRTVYPRASYGIA